MQEQFYPEQSTAFNDIMHAISTQKNAAFFIDGPGGSGKSFLFEALLHATRGAGHIVVACAWSGLAASLLPGGRTCHARFGFPVPLPPTDVPWSVRARTGKGQLLIRARALIWDEVPPAPASVMEAADRCLRDLCQVDLPFGGKVVLFSVAT